jgi:hypothetical protein
VIQRIRPADEGHDGTIRGMAQLDDIREPKNLVEAANASKNRRGKAATRTGMPPR